MSARCRACGQCFNAENNPVGVPIGQACTPKHRGPFDPQQFGGGSREIVRTKPVTIKNQPFISKNVF